MTRNRKTVPALLALVALIAGGAGMVAARSQADWMPAGHSPAAGRFVWQDLITPDAGLCRRFYADLMGWEFRETTRRGRPYLVARVGGKAVGGIVELKDPRLSRAAWLSYLAVDDLDRALDKVRSAGGSVLVEPVRAGAFGRAAVVTDPQGAPLGLAGLEIEPPAEPSDPPMGRFFWREYFARDAGTALAFYKALNGYEDTLSERAEQVEYHVLRREGPRAGLFQIPAEVTEVKPNWLPYLRVEDPAAMATRAESLGGRVILAPRSEIRGGTVAIVADPAGGVVALQKWPL